MPTQPNKEKSDAKPVEQRERSSWSADQKLREYYYDDAHGYEEFVDDEEEDESGENRRSDDAISSDAR
ncbi:MAG: hypothetical protein HOP17_17890 [Acidobacteria bacterium]|nr:hypothetical protein [Acidobacteriota bacterium]